MALFNNNRLKYWNRPTFSLNGYGERFEIDVIKWFQKNKKSTNNFDSEFTHEKVTLTPCDANFIKKINQSEFAGFSYFNEEEFLRR